MTKNKEKVELEKLELNDEGLEKVTGGWGDGYVDKYEGIVGQEYYFVESYSKWFRGVLEYSYEQGPDCHTIRTHGVKVTEPNRYPYSVGEVVEVSGDRFDMYTSR